MYTQNQAVIFSRFVIYNEKKGNIGKELARKTPDQSWLKNNSRVSSAQKCLEMLHFN